MQPGRIRDSTTVGAGRITLPGEPAGPSVVEEYVEPMFGTKSKDGLPSWKSVITLITLATVGLVVETYQGVQYVRGYWAMREH